MSVWENISLEPNQFRVEPKNIIAIKVCISLRNTLEWEFLKIICKFKVIRETVPVLIKSTKNVFI